MWRTEATMCAALRARTLLLACRRTLLKAINDAMDIVLATDSTAAVFGEGGRPYTPQCFYLHTCLPLPLALDRFPSLTVAHWGGVGCCRAVVLSWLRARSWLDWRDMAAGSTLHAHSRLHTRLVCHGTCQVRQKIRIQHAQHRAGAVRVRWCGSALVRQCVDGVNRVPLTGFSIVACTCVVLQPWQPDVAFGGVFRATMDLRDRYGVCATAYLYIARTHTRTRARVSHHLPSRSTPPLKNCLAALAGDGNDAYLLAR